jgi:type II secretory pathway pseudopilin PulG
MAEPRKPNRASGFSLVELMVALVFTLVLMAGMASVFKSSLASFYTSGETLSNARRNMMSMDLLTDDLNTACTYILDPVNGPTFGPGAMPPFYVLPNCSLTGAPNPLGTGDPSIADELYFYADVPLPFQGTLGLPSQRSANELVNQGSAMAAADNTYTIQCNNNTYAAMVQQGQYIIFLDKWTLYQVTAAPVPTGTSVSVVLGADPNSAITGVGASGAAQQMKPIQGSGVVFVQPTNMIRYRVQYLALNPVNSDSNMVPCLVRDQGTYDPVLGFVLNANNQQQIVTENVTGFKVYLSLNSGQTWAGLGLAAGSPAPAPGGGFVANWQGQFLPLLNAQLTTAGRPGYTPATQDPNWFRDNPTLVRFDITTRTATQRTEYSTTPNTAAYKQLTQSLVFVPRQSGLPVGP